MYIPGSKIEVITNALVRLLKCVNIIAMRYVCAASTLAVTTRRTALTIVFLARTSKCTVVSLAVASDYS